MDLESSSEVLAQSLRETRSTLVLAESCTGGLVASTLAQIPGISQWLAGSMVVYQEASKMRWLGVDSETLAAHTAVSAAVAHQMVTGVLKATPHADIAAAVTGHLGPQAPEGFDGLVYLAVARRSGPPAVHQVQLVKTKRIARQREAAGRVIEALVAALGATRG